MRDYKKQSYLLGPDQRAFAHTFDYSILLLGLDLVLWYCHGPFGLRADPGLGTNPWYGSAADLARDWLFWHRLRHLPLQTASCLAGDPAFFSWRGG